MRKTSFCVKNCARKSMERRETQRKLNEEIEIGFFAIKSMLVCNLMWQKSRENWKINI